MEIFYKTFVWLCTSMAFWAPFAAAHCPGINYSLDTLSQKIVVQEKCYAGFPVCVLDTFYQDSLEADLKRAADGSQYISLFEMGEFSTSMVVDTNWLGENSFQLDSVVIEEGSIRHLTNLKGNSQHGDFVFTNRWVVPDTMSFQSLVDTPFIAFYNAYDSLENLNIHPNQDCLLEPTTYTIKNGRISKRGVDGVRMPGVSFPFSEFLQIIDYTGDYPLEIRKEFFVTAAFQGWEIFNLKGEKLQFSAPLSLSNLRQTLESFPRGMYLLVPLQKPDKRTGVSLAHKNSILFVNGIK